VHNITNRKSCCYIHIKVTNEPGKKSRCFLIRGARLEKMRCKHLTIRKKISLPIAYKNLGQKKRAPSPLGTKKGCFPIRDAGLGSGFRFRARTKHQRSSDARRCPETPGDIVSAWPGPPPECVVNAGTVVPPPILPCVSTLVCKNEEDCGKLHKEGNY